MKADNIKPLLFKLISYSIFRVFSIAPLSEESSNFRKVLLVFFDLKSFENRFQNIENNEKSPKYYTLVKTE